MALLADSDEIRAIVEDYLEAKQAQEELDAEANRILDEEEAAEAAKRGDELPPDEDYGDGTAADGLKDDEDLEAGAAAAPAAGDEADTPAKARAKERLRERKKRRDYRRTRRGAYLCINYTLQITCALLVTLSLLWATIQAMRIFNFLGVSNAPPGIVHAVTDDDAPVVVIR
jgi:hypothetical protein